MQLLQTPFHLSKRPGLCCSPKQKKRLTGSTPGGLGVLNPGGRLKPGCLSRQRMNQRQQIIEMQAICKAPICLQERLKHGAPAWQSAAQ
jgi:hypothetical protein